MTETLDPAYAGEGIYREHILDHYKSPRNAGALENPAFVHREFNPLCGDEITFSVRLDGKRIGEARFLGRGCAISQAAASMLSETLPGRSLEEIKALQRDHVLELLGIPLGPVRIKCAVLGLVALKNGIALYEKGIQRMQGKEQYG